MRFYKTMLGICLVFLQSLIFTMGGIVLEHHSTVYLPHGYDPEIYEFDSGAVEQSAVDSKESILYAVGGNYLQVIDFSEVTNPTIVHYVKVAPNFDDGTLNDVEACGNLVAVVYQPSTNPLKGRAMVFRRYNTSDNMVMEKLHEVDVGAVPDCLKFTKDCMKIVVAIEGEIVDYGGTLVDPEGGATIIEFQRDGTAPAVTFANFTSYNARADEYIQRGVRKIYNGQGTNDINGTTLSQDLEPEYIAFNSDESLVYIPLQENNAMAVLDVATKEFIEIYPLGYKDYSPGNSGKLDPSDKDGGAYINNWGDGISGLFGMYQPDGIAFITFENKQYILTANEGDSKETGNWEEVIRGKDIVEAGMVHSNVSGEFIALLSNETQLGRLEFSAVDGNENISKFVNPGGRSIAAFRVEDMSLAYDSGDEIEQAIKSTYLKVFNANCRDKNQHPHDSFDSRSDDKGSEPEALTHGNVNGKTIIFVGLERPGLIVMYSIVPGTDLELQYEDIYYGGGLDDTWGNMWTARTTRDLEPEDLLFLPADRSPSGSPMLIVTGAVSGTVSFYDVKDMTQTTPDTSNSNNRDTSLHLMFITCILSILKTI